MSLMQFYVFHFHQTHWCKTFQKYHSKTKNIGYAVELHEIFILIDL